MPQVFNDLVKAYRQTFSSEDLAEEDEEDPYFEAPPDLLLPWCKQAFKSLMLTDQEGNSIMRDYAKISPKFWIGETGREMRELGLPARALAFYLMTSPHSNMLGIYYLPIVYMMY